MFYPIYIDEESRVIKKLGQSIPFTTDYKDIPQIPGLRAFWPLRPDGTEATWRMQPSTLEEKIKRGLVRIGEYDKKNDRYTILYLAEVQEERIKKGDIVITGHREDGSVDILEPHGNQYADNLPKAKALAKYAKIEDRVGRIQLIHKNTDAGGVNRFVRLDLTDIVVREKVLSAVTNEELSHIFDTDGVSE